MNISSVSGQDVSEQDVERAFLEFLAELGIPLSRGALRLDGRMHRYHVEGDQGSERNGAYAVYMDGRPAGWAMSWSAKHGVPEPVTWVMKRSELTPLTQEEKKRYAEEMQRRRRQRDESISEMRAEAAHRAQAMWNAATPVGEALRRPGQYLNRKKLREPVGARQLGNDLLIPLYSPEGELVNVQRISPDGTKRFLSGGVTGGCFCVLAEEEAERGRYVFLCEGWATGATIHEATGCAVVVAWSCGNLKAVAQWARKRWPSKLALASDFDHKTAGNPGTNVGFAVAEELDLPLAVPPFKTGERGTDWNDYAALHDVEETSRALFEAVEKWEKYALEDRKRAPVWVDVTEKGRPKPTIANLEVLLRRQGITLKYDEIAKDAVVDVPGARYCNDGKEAAGVAHVLSLCAEFGLPGQYLEEYLTNIAMRNAVNPVRDWIASKSWDGTDRFGPFCDTLKADDGFPEDFKTLILRRWLVSAVAAVFKREAFHNRGVLVLQGPQGMGKTSWLARLTPQSSGWFASRPSLDIKDKDSLKQALGYWIVELGELEGVLKGDMAKLKAFLTLDRDEMRPPYGRKSMKFQRRTVFSASVNQAEFLSDPTGNSRWWVIPCSEIDYRHEIDMQQLWAQMAELYRAGERWYFDKAEEEKLSQNNWQFEQADEIQDLLQKGFDWGSYETDVELGNAAYMSATEALQKCGVELPTHAQAIRAGQALCQLTGKKPHRSAHGKRLYLMPRFIQTQWTG
jgi:putative DNA primase/helicase